MTQPSTYAFSGPHGFTDTVHPIVFIHGAGMDHTVWTLPARHFIRHNRNVLAIDLPGHGRSNGRPCTTIDSMAEWTIAYLDELGIREFSVVGHSMGSLVALEVAAMVGDRAKNLVMVGISIPMPVGNFLLESAKKNDPQAIDILTYMGYSSSGRLGCNSNPGIWMTGTTKRLLEKSSKDIIYVDLKACTEYSHGLESAAKVMAEVMLILGTKDYLTPMRRAEDLIKTFKQPNVRRIQDSGHSLMTEKPNIVLDYLREALI